MRGSRSWHKVVSVSLTIPGEDGYHVWARRKSKGDNDQLFGGSGADLLVGGADGARLVGGSGNDVIRVRASEWDRINCGTGHDRGFADADDEDLTSSNCEIVRKAVGD